MLTRLTFPVRLLAMARRTAALLEETLSPSPVAVSLFESKEAGYLVEAYFDEPVNGDEIAAAFRQEGIEGIAAVMAAAVPDLDWVSISQAALPPVAAGRFIVHGSHDRRRIGRRLYAIEIDAGEAFGTAHHATTYGCLEAIDQLSRAHRFTNVLDLGCGTGVLAVAAAYASPSARVLASDIDPEAVRIASGNVRLNGAARQVSVVLAEGMELAAIRRRQPFDLVIANILANPLKVLAPTIARSLAPGGLAILSGLLIAHVPEVVAAYRSVGFDVVSKRDLLGWTVVVLRQANR